VPLTYPIYRLGHHALPAELRRATDDDVDDVLRRAAAFVGRGDVDVARVASVVGGSCVACVDVVASVGGVPLLVARPDVL
jgi:hypothetical protein